MIRMTLSSICQSAYLYQSPIYLRPSFNVIKPILPFVLNPLCCIEPALITMAALYRLPGKNQSVTANEQDGSLLAKAERSSSTSTTVVHDQQTQENKTTRYQDTPPLLSTRHTIPLGNLKQRCSVFRSLLSGSTGLYKSRPQEERLGNKKIRRPITLSLQPHISKNNKKKKQQQLLSLSRCHHRLPISLGLKVLYARIDELEGRNKRLRLRALVLERKRDRAAQLEQMHREYADQLEARLLELRKSLAAINA